MLLAQNDMIDDGNDMVAGTSEMGSMVNGKKGEWEERDYASPSNDLLKCELTS